MAGTLSRHHQGFFPDVDHHRLAPPAPVAQGFARVWPRGPLGPLNLQDLCDLSAGRNRSEVMWYPHVSSEWYPPML